MPAAYPTAALKTKKLTIPATLAVIALALPGCPSSEPEPEEHETCFCEVPQGRDAGSFADAGVADSGCASPSEAVCFTV